MDSVDSPIYLDDWIELVLDVWCEGYVHWFQRAK